VGDGRREMSGKGRVAGMDDGFSSVAISFRWVQDCGSLPRGREDMSWRHTSLWVSNSTAMSFSMMDITEYSVDTAN
jgi:hypothetical protein